MKMKTFQADTMQEALSLVKDEMGPDAVILKSRRATRKVGGKMQNCFEVTAAMDEALFARPEPMPASSRAPVESRASAESSRSGNRTIADTSRPSARGLAASPAAAIAAARQAASQPAPAPGMYDWKGSLRRVDEEGKANNAGRSGNAPSQPPAANSGSLIELLRSEIREMKDHVNAPSQEIKELKDEIKAMMESANARTQAAARAEAARLASTQATQKTMGRAGASQPLSPSAFPAQADTHGLQDCLTEMEIEPELAAELIRASGVRNPGRRMDAAFGTPEAAEQDAEILAQCMAERIRVTGGIRLMPGRPTTIALVGPTGVGKTTTLAKLAALAKIQQGKKVGIISADSFRMGANEQLELFGRTAGIPVRPVFSPADVAQAQKEFAHCDLILVDTAGRSHTHMEMWRELQGLLRCLHPDEIHLVLGGPTRMRELWHQYGLYRDLGATSLIFTKLDECLTLGCLYNLARRAEAPLSYLCNGQVIPDHILLAKPETVASAIAAAAKTGMLARSGSAGYGGLASRVAR